MPLLTIPSGSIGGPNVIVAPYILKNADGTWRYVGNTGTASLTQYNPTSSTGAIMALVYLDTVSGNPYLLIGSGTVFSASLTGSSQIYSYIPQSINPNWIPDAAIRLVSGTSTIGWDNIYDVRQFLQIVPTGSSGGLSSIAIQDEGVVKGNATTFNFVGTVVDASISGTVVRVFVTGSTGGSAFVGDPSSVVLTNATGSLATYPWLKWGTSSEEFIEFGADAIGKETNAGKMGYQAFDAQYFTMIGAGTGVGVRRLQFLDRIVTEYAEANHINIAGGDTYNIDGSPHGHAVNTGTFLVQDEAINLGGATTLNLVGQGVAATISGTVARLKIPGTSRAYIDGLKISYVSSGAIQVSPGTAYNEGLQDIIELSLAANVTLPTPLPTGVWQSVYLWKDSGGTARIQVTGTAPEIYGYARIKAGDFNYRYLGSLLVDPGGFLYRFGSAVVGNCLEMNWTENQAVAPFVLSSITGTTAQTMSVAGLVPYATSGIADRIGVIGVITAPATTTWSAGISESIPTSNSAETVFRADNQTASSVILFFPPFPIEISGTTIQAIVSVGTVSLGVRIRGIRIPR